MVSGIQIYYLENFYDVSSRNLGYGWDSEDKIFVVVNLGLVSAVFFGNVQAFISQIKKLFDIDYCGFRTGNHSNTDRILNRMTFIFDL